MAYTPWNTWTCPETVTTSYTTYTGTVVWGNWCDNRASITSAATTWNNWMDNTVDTGYHNPPVSIYPEPQRRTPAELRQERINREYQQYLQELERIKREKERREAEEKALKLLRDTLTPVQLKRFERDQCIPVDTAKGNKYLIKKGRQRNIEVYRKDGVITHHKLCAHPKENCPDYDTMLAQKLFLERAEDEFLKIANVS